MREVGEILIRRYFADVSHYSDRVLKAQGLKIAFLSLKNFRKISLIFLLCTFSIVFCAVSIFSIITNWSNGNPLEQKSLIMAVSSLIFIAILLSDFFLIRFFGLHKKMSEL